MSPASIHPAPALAKGRANVALNGFEASQTTWLDADVNASLRQFDREGRKFDAIVLDPPKLAPTAAHAERAARAYKDLNRWGFKLLNPRRHAVHVLMLRRHRGGAVPEDCGQRPHWRRGWMPSSPTAWAVRPTTRWACHSLRVST
jgi:hypothetical protein